MQHITHQTRYLTLPILPNEEGMYTAYLDSNWALIEYALRCYSKVFAFRVDLRLPDGYNYLDTNLITRFFSSFKAMIKAQYYAKKRNNDGYVHPTEVHFVRVREVGGSGKPHYHICILLNGNAYWKLGKFADSNSLSNKVNAAWASALNTHSNDGALWPTDGLVSFPDYCSYMLDRSKTDLNYQISELNKRLSYLAKVATKPRGNGIRCYGTSRIPKPQFVGGV
ncbi:inovirus Gp2 family protein [Alteromonas gracilis]|uniref:inovirus Gp2 family protein n=1 Tax=Alteromonas gracilis TaxID=1479524 RepID=UPI0030CDDE42